MPFRAIRDRGIPVALGSDEAICGDAVEMWGVVKMAGLIHTITGCDSDRWPTAHEVLDALWRGGAAAMTRAGELGEVRAGALADLALLDLHSPTFTPLTDVTGQLVYCDPASSVTLVMVDGVVVAQDSGLGVDGVQVWIDTRDTRNVHRAPRVCPRFAATITPGL